MKPLADIRKKMKALGIQALIVPSNDPHFSEYPADYWKVRGQLSGYNGSAGILTITGDSAALWTDSRYHLQAQQRLKGSDIEVLMQPHAGTENFDEHWFYQKLNKSDKIGIDTQLFSLEAYYSLQKRLHAFEIVDTNKLETDIWPNRAALPGGKAYILSEIITGKSRKQKIEDLVKNADAKKVVLIISALDEIAWLLNIRGEDVKYNPVVISWLVIEYPAVHFFVDRSKFDEKDRNELEKDGIVLHNYIDFYQYLPENTKNKKICINISKTNVYTYNLLQKASEIVEENCKYGNVAVIKAVKNKTEIEGFRKSMIADGVAMVQFIKWLYENVGKTTVTEGLAAEKSEYFRWLNSDYKGLSFRTISAVEGNAAMPHYWTAPNSDIEIKTGKCFLIDSGAQYITGTTDITRTFFFTKPSIDQINDYTLVLKGMLALSAAKFPANTSGYQIDILARQFLWQKGKNYFHGTGHGVGCFLNVHEGPHSIRAGNLVSFLPGMVVSNEPAVYVEGKYGIRTENMLLCVDNETTDYGSFLSFETLTLCPIETVAINTDIMSSDEIVMLNNYHKTVYDKLAPELNYDECSFLKKITTPI